MRLSATLRSEGKTARVVRVERAHLLRRGRDKGDLHSEGVRIHDSPGTSIAQRESRCVRNPRRMLRPTP